MTRTNHIVVWSGACASFVAIYFYFHRPHADQVLPATQPSPSVFLPQRKEHSAAHTARSAVVEEVTQAETVPLRAEIAAPQKDPLTNGLERILSSIQEVEMANKRTIHEGRFPAGQTARMQIMQPSVEQMEKIQGALSQALDTLPPESPAARQLTERGNRLINDYCSYPKPIKVIAFVERNGKVEFFEWYGPDLEMFLPNKDGSLPVPLPPDAKLNIDDKFGASDSWATKRYSHLFDFER